MITTFELIALITGIGSAILLVKNHVWTWPVGIVSLIAYAVVMYDAEMFGNMIIQFIFIGQSLYGWYYWFRHDQIGNLPITSYSDPFSPKRILIVMAVSVVSIGCSKLLGSGDALLDGLISGFSLIALMLSIWRKIENWYFWLALDVLSIYYFYHEGLYVGALSYVLLLVVATTGYLQWRKDLRPALS